MNPKNKKNISPELHDIRHPQKTGPVRQAPKIDKPGVAKKEKSSRLKLSVKNHSRWSAVGISTILVIGIGYGVYSTGFLNETYKHLKNRESQGLWTSLDEKDAFGVVPDLLWQLPHVVGNIREVVTAFREIGAGVNDLNSKGLALVFNGGGEELIDILKRIHRNLGLLDGLGISLNENMTSSGLPPGYAAPDGLSDIGEIHDALGAIIGFFDAPEERRIALLFENHSEIRPTGGFIGSYGELIINKGSIRDINVDDIYTPDRNSEYRVIPPIQLQSITTGWGARDANWFFDFPVSANKVLEFIEASELYIHNEKTFDGAVAMNANVVADMLGAVGPVYLPEYDVTLTGENFLFTVREEIEEARDENPKENPKQILGAVMPIIIERLQDIDDEKKSELILSLLERSFTKDIRFYFRDEELQRVVEKTPFSGKVFAIPEVFSGDYLAVVNSNIAGGKTDIFVDQDIFINSQMTSNGIIKNEVVVRRKHQGDGREQALYGMDNQNYTKIFTMPSSKLNFAEGVTEKKIVAKIDYEEEGYESDPELSSIEDTLQVLSGFGIEKYLESGKNVFGAWFSTPAGETNELKLTYQSGTALVHHGAKYQFVFDKQPGVESGLEYKVSSPPGYHWKETGNAFYEYRHDGILPVRVVIDLTLMKNE